MRKARLAGGAAGLVLLALLLGGCVEDVRQADARRAVEARVALLDAYSGDVRCTRNPRPWFVEREANVFLCAARLEQGGCDIFRATRASQRWNVALDERDAGCSLPA